MKKTLSVLSAIGIIVSSSVSSVSCHGLTWKSSGIKIDSALTVEEFNNTVITPDLLNENGNIKKFSNDFIQDHNDKMYDSITNSTNHLTGLTDEVSYSNSLLIDVIWGDSSNIAHSLFGKTLLNNSQTFDVKWHYRQKNKSKYNEDVKMDVFASKLSNTCYTLTINERILYWKPKHPEDILKSPSGLYLSSIFDIKNNKQYDGGVKDQVVIDSCGLK